MKVAVLLSTYNGEPFLMAQLRSLLSQTYHNVDIYIRDDGSTDGTRDMLATIAREDSRVIVDYGDNIGCIRSFLSLVKKVEADIYLFCDQDDIWFDWKVEQAVRFFEDIREEIPTLYHTDLEVVDEHLQTIHSSFHAYQGLDPSIKSDSIYVQNYVVGCTSAFNRTLRDKIIKNTLPEQVAMHDWWCALIAKTQGQLCYNSQASMLYRQHGKNVLGATETGLTTYIQSWLSGSGMTRFFRFRHLLMEQTDAFLQVYASELSEQQKEKLLLIKKSNTIIGVVRCLAKGLRPQGKVRVLAWIYCAVCDAFFRSSERKS